jgi:hypothetical protein
MRSFEACLSHYRRECAERHVIAKVSRDCHASSLRGVLELAVAASSAYHIPSIRLESTEYVANLHARANTTRT